MRHKVKLTIELDPDTAAFLSMSRDQPEADDASEFINSLIRQERFRRGYLAANQKGQPRFDLTTPQKARQLRKGHLF